MTALPTVGGDNGNWGTILNNYLSTEHKTDGTHGLSTGLVTDEVNSQVEVGTTIPSPYTVPAPTVAGISDLTLTANCTLTFPTAVRGQSFTMVIRQGGAGSFVITWPASIVKWDGGVAPTLTTTAGAVDILGFMCVDGTNWFGFVSGQDMK